MKVSGDLERQRPNKSYGVRDGWEKITIIKRVITGRKLERLRVITRESERTLTQLSIGVKPSVTGKLIPFYEITQTVAFAEIECLLNSLSRK